MNKYTTRSPGGSGPMSCWLNIQFRIGGILWLLLLLTLVIGYCVLSRLQEACHHLVEISGSLDWVADLNKPLAGWPHSELEDAVLTMCLRFTFFRLEHSNSADRSLSVL